METEKDIPEAIHDSATIITNMPNLNNDIGQFVKEIILMLCDKFVDDELLNTRIVNKVGGNMKVVEDYADRVAERKINEKNEALVIKLRKKGFKIEEIAETKNINKGGSMNIVQRLKRKIIERLAKNIMEEKLAKIVINLDKQGYMLEAIAELADVSLDFVKKTLYR